MILCVFVSAIHSGARQHSFNEHWMLFSGLIKLRQSLLDLILPLLMIVWTTDWGNSPFITNSLTSSFCLWPLFLNHKWEQGILADWAEWTCWQIAPSAGWWCSTAPTHKHKMKTYSHGALFSLVVQAGSCIVWGRLLDAWYQHVRRSNERTLGLTMSSCDPQPGSTG